MKWPPLDLVFLHVVPRESYCLGKLFILNTVELHWWETNPCYQVWIFFFMWLHLLAFFPFNRLQRKCDQCHMYQNVGQDKLFSPLYGISSGYWDNKKVTNSLLSGTAIYTVHTCITSLVDSLSSIKPRVKDINQHCFFSDVFLNVVFLFEIPLSL